MCRSVIQVQLQKSFWSAFHSLDVRPLELPMQREGLRDYALPGQDRFGSQLLCRMYCAWHGIMRWVPPMCTWCQEPALTLLCSWVATIHAVVPLLRLCYFYLSGRIAIDLVLQQWHASLEYNSIIIIIIIMPAQERLHGHAHAQLWLSSFLGTVLNLPMHSGTQGFRICLKLSFPCATYQPDVPLWSLW